MDLRFDSMTIKHASAVMKIFNYYIENSLAAYPESPLPEAAFAIFLEKAKGYPAYVITDTGTDQVAGFCLLHAYSPFAAFKQSAEVTYFLAPEAVRRGIGTMVLERLESDARKMQIKHLLANISSENQPSLAFHRKHGFTECGCLHQIGRKQGRTFDVVWMEKTI
jgi:L-amino acid N-acyltransferase YncA